LEADLDAHNVGQKKLMAKFIPGHIKGAALAILLREVGHALTRVMGFYRSLAGIQRSISTTISKSCRRATGSVNVFHNANGVSLQTRY